MVFNYEGEQLSFLQENGSKNIQSELKRSIIYCFLSAFYVEKIDVGRNEKF